MALQGFYYECKYRCTRYRQQHTIYNNIVLYLYVIHSFYIGRMEVSTQISCKHRSTKSILSRIPNLRMLYYNRDCQHALFLSVVRHRQITTVSLEFYLKIILIVFSDLNLK